VEYTDLCEELRAFNRPMVQEAARVIELLEKKIETLEAAASDVPENVDFNADLDFLVAAHDMQVRLLKSVTGNPHVLERSSVVERQVADWSKKRNAADLAAAQMQRYWRLKDDLLSNVVKVTGFVNSLPLMFPGYEPSQLDQLENMVRCLKQAFDAADVSRI